MVQVARRSKGAHGSWRRIPGAKVIRDSYGPNSSVTPPAFTPADLSPALWIDPSDAATVTISGSSGAYIGPDGLVLPGSGTNGAQAPSNPVYQISGDLDLIAKATMATWAAGNAAFICHGGTGTNIAYYFYIDSAGRLALNWVEPVGPTARVALSTVSVPFGSSATGFVRVTLDVDNGAGAYEVKFWTSTDGVSWTQLGSTVVGAATTSMQAITRPLEVGSRNGGAASPFNGTIHRAIVKNGIDGTTVFDADFESATPYVSAFTESALGAPVYVVSSTATSATADYSYIGPNGFVSRAGANRAETPDAAALDITGDIDLIAKLTAPSWSTGVQMNIITKGTAASTAADAWVWRIQASGVVGFTTSTGGAYRNVASTVATGIAAGATKWMRVTRASSSGDVKFYLSDDGVTWTQLGATVNDGGGAINNGTTPLYVGAYGTNAQNWIGTIHRAIVKNGIDGTTVFDANFEAAPDYATSFTESSSNAATVTITATNTPANAAGALVSQINDKSGNARHLTQGTAANMPKYWNGRNGKNCLVFDGSSDSLSVAWTGLTNNFFVSAFARVNDTGGSKVLVGLGNDLYPMWFSSAELLQGYIVAGGVNSVAAVNRVIGSTAMTSMTTTAPRCWLDGTLATGVSTSSASGGTFNLGQSSISLAWYSGECGEVVVVLTTPADGDIASLQAYYESAWGTP